MRKLVEGVGIYAPGKFASVIPGTGKHTKEYQTWRDMLKRCYTSSDKNYEGYSVAREWLEFQVFAQWLEDNGFSEDHRLDKDIFARGRKWYGPETCCLVPVCLNSLIVSRKGADGVTIRKDRNSRTPFVVRCMDSSGSRIYLGAYASEDWARTVYRDFKSKAIREVAQREFAAGRIKADVLEVLLDWNVE